MSTYYWSKYKSKATATYTESATWTKTGDTGISNSPIYTSYTFNKNTNKYSCTGAVYWTKTQLSPGATYYIATVTGVVKYVIISHTLGSNPRATRYEKLSSNSTSNTTYSRGDFVSTITGSYGAYTNNTRNADGYWYVRGSLVNSVPTVTLTSPIANATIYENDTFTIDGAANDTNSGDVVTVRYQINAETVRAIDSFVSNGGAKAFGKQLTFKGSSLYDGDTLIASNLTDGTAHTLKVYATDDRGSTSTVVSRTFYTVPNRAPSLTVNAPTTAGNTDADKINFTGHYIDADGNNAVVQYRINGGNSVQIAEGVSGSFEFDVTFAQLQTGLNNIIVEVIDSYGSKTSRTVKLNKSAIETPILQSTARYKIQPPTGSAKSVLLWITREEGLAIDVSISMGMQGEAEVFTPVSVSNSAPSPDFANAVEDEFYLESDSKKDNIILQVDMSRASVDVSPKIYIIQGVLE